MLTMRPTSPAHAVLTVLALAAGGQALALGLGNARGAVFVGRPLQLSIPATVEASDPEAPCLEADVFQGDVRVNPSRVSTRWEAGAAGAGTVRVLADIPVEEPVVTVYLRVGCANKVTRRYVLLAEQPVEGERSGASQAAKAPRPASPPGVAVPPARAAAAPGPAAAAARAPAVVVAQAPAAPRVRPAASAPPKAAAAPRAQPSRKAQPEPARRPQARLVLEPLEFDAQTLPVLRGTAALAAAPNENDPARQQAAALWAAISAGPEVTLRNGERIQVLERGVASLRDLTVKNTAVLQEARDQLVAARGDRDAMSRVAMGLALALLGALALAAWAWRRGGAARNAWWRPRVAGPDTEIPSGLYAEEIGPASEPASSLRRAHATAPVVTDSVAPAVPPPSDFDLSFTHSALDKLRADSRAAAGGLGAGKWRPSHADAGLSRLKAEEVIDVQQQAEFFLSIGQVERALSLLEAHVQQPSQTSALAWLDLLEIYHDEGRREDYDRVRDAFRAQFKAQVPAFDDYRAGSDGLEKYGRALSRIVSLWPSHRALAVIEESLMRKPGEESAEAFDLEAYRELVLLYNIAKEVGEAPPPKAVAASDSRSGFGATDMVGLSAMAGIAPVAAATPAPPDASAFVPPASSRLGLDIDLFGLEDVDAAGLVPAGSSEPTDAPLPRIDVDHPVTAPAPSSQMLDFTPDWKPPPKKG